MQKPHQDAVYRRYIFYSLLLSLLGLIGLAVMIAIGIGVLRQHVERWGAYQKGDFLNADGYHPVTIVRGDDGYIYGVTDSGGIYGHGVLYRLSPQNGAFRVTSHLRRQLWNRALCANASTGWMGLWGCRWQ